MLEYLDGVTKEEFGWGLEEKYHEIKPEERYLPLVMEAFHSKEARNLEDWMGRLRENDDARNIKKEIEWFAHDLERFERRGMEEIDDRLPEVLPDGRNRRDLNRMEEDRMRSEGIHIENDDIKDFAEDLEHIVEHVEDFLDPENEYTAEGIKLDAEMRFSAPV